MTWKVYKVSFLDGFAYVGITKGAVEDRIKRHVARPCNSELSARLVADEYTVEILHDNVLTSMVMGMERAEILALEKPINIHGTQGRTPHFGRPMSPDHQRKRPGRKRIKPVRPGRYRCSRCHVMKHHFEFHKDRSRFNGLNSRCKECFRRLNMDAYWFKKRMAADAPNV